jgi:hypothetical protein
VLLVTALVFNAAKIVIAIIVKLGISGYAGAVVRAIELGVITAESSTNSVLHSF